nr:clostripain-related cysteine peptidase [Paenibacillus turpanensis]
MNGSDLESEDGAGAASKDLEEMMAIGSTDNVKVVVETGGTLQWNNPNISGEENQRWLVEKDGIQLLSEGLGARNIGEPATLLDFVTWGVKEYPADRYVLLFWDHGAGSVNGFGADELHNGDSLLLPEIQQAMSGAVKETGVSFELVGFDACLMATVETASLFAPYSKYFIASEELEPGHGWNYTPFLDYLTKNTNASGAELGQVITDGYRAQAEAEGTASEITLSVIDLTQIDEVEAALGSLVEKAALDLGQPERIQAIAKARSRSEDYGSSGAHGGNTDMVDLADLTGQISSLYPAEAKKLLKSIEDAVVYSINSTTKPKAAGLSVYFPYKDKENFQSNLETYRTLSFSKAYLDFVESYVEVIDSDAEPVQFTNAAPEAAASEESSGGAMLYQVALDKTDIAEIAEAYSVLTTYADENTLVTLGMDDSVTIDEETGILEDEFTGEWVTLDGNLVSMFVNGHGDDFTEYAIPAKLNGEEVDILVTLNYETGESRIIGAWRGIDELSGMADKNILKIKAGDRVTPMFYTYNEASGEDGFLEGETFTVGQELALEGTVLPEGQYQYGFYLIDFAQNESYSDFVEIDWTGETAGAGDAAEEPVDPNAVHVEINGELQEYVQPPVIINDKTMVPLRAIFEALGATVEWEAATQTATAEKDGTVVVLQIGNPVAAVDGEAVTLQQAAELVNGHTMVPARFVSEALGAEVKWDGTTRTVIITYE